MDGHSFLKPPSSSFIYSLLAYPSLMPCSFHETRPAGLRSYIVFNFPPLTSRVCLRFFVQQSQATHCSYLLSPGYLVHLCLMEKSEARTARNRCNWEFATHTCGLYRKSVSQNSKVLPCRDSKRRTSFANAVATSTGKPLSQSAATLDSRW
jgi:hypothetical protein